MSKFHRLSLQAAMVLAFSSGALAESLVLRTAAQDNNALKYDLKNTQKPGICIEVIQAIEKLDPEIKFSGWDTVMSLPRIEMGLTEGRLDAFCALIKTSAREAKYAFVDTPVYTVRHRIAVRADDTVNVKSFDEIRALGNDGVVIGAKGTAHEDLLKQQGGLLLELSSGDTAVNLRLLVGKRGRFFYHTENALLYYIEAGALEGKVKLLPTIFKEDGLYFAVARALPPASVERLRAALDKLAKRGTLNKIYANYKES